MDSLSSLLGKFRASSRPCIKRQKKKYMVSKEKLWGGSLAFTNMHMELCPHMHPYHIRAHVNTAHTCPCAWHQKCLSLILKQLEAWNMNPSIPGLSQHLTIRFHSLVLYKVCARRTTLGKLESCVHYFPEGDRHTQCKFVNLASNTPAPL